MATESELLRESFKYDLWANQTWLTFLTEKGSPADELAVLRHVMGAQEIWLTRCQGQSLTAIPSREPSKELLQSLNAQWQEQIQAQPLEEPISYRRTTGESNVQTRSRIARHVIDHGAYHRGQIRAMVGTRGWEDFPETGLMGYFFNLD
jgi:uncharacterized damage-inducible protein DinB